MTALLALIVLASPAPNGPQKLSLQQALTAARSAPGPQAAKARAEAAEEAADAQWRRGRLPRIGVGAEYRRIHEPLEITTPIGPFQTEPERVLAVGVELTQPLFEADALLYAEPAARADARAANHAARRAAESRAYAAGQAWLAVRRVDAQVAATQAFEKSLAERANLMQAQVDAGRGLEADRLKVSLALDQARQDLRALAQRRRIATLQLAQATGMAGGVDVDPGAALPSTETPAQRADLAALDAQIDALAIQQDAVWGELWPSVVLNGKASYADTDLVPDRKWVEAGVQLRWVPFAGGTRGARADALAAQTRAIRAQQSDARRQAALDVANAQAQLATARGQLEVATRGIEQAQASLALEQKRYAAQRATMNDVIAAQAQLRERRTRSALADLDVLGAELTLRWAEGRL
jgi:outer membrane protein TolC